MDDRIPGAILSVLLFIWAIITIFFFTSTGITTNNFMTINLAPLMQEMLTTNFIAFIVSISITLGLILVLGRKYKFKYSIVFIYPPIILGLLASFFLFQKTILNFGIPIIGLLIGILIGVRFIANKENELKYLKTFRAGAFSTDKILLIGIVVFFLYLIILGSAQKEELKNGFVTDFLGVTVGDGISIGETFQVQFAGAIALQQQSAIDQVLSMQEMKNLTAKNDPDGLLLAAKLEAMKAVVVSDDFKKGIANQLKAQNIDFGKEITKQIPLITTIAQSAWIMYPILALITLLFISNIIIKNLTGLVYAIIMLIFPKNASQNSTPQNVEPQKKK
ncbi:MAG: hypothetical protein WCW13_03365 [archaeon]|jgi:hypothetical protein